LVIIIGDGLGLQGASLTVVYRTILATIRPI
jgi:hypothetical protein